MDARAIADLLEEYGQRLMLAQLDPYRPKAYLRAAETLRHWPAPLAALLARGELQSLPGIGPAIAQQVETLHRTGSEPRLEALRRQLPESLLELFRVPGLRAPQIKTLHDKLGVTNLGSLQAALASGAVAQTKGLGARLAKTIEQGLAMHAAGSHYRRLDQAESLLASACAHLRGHRPDLTRITPAGDWRRGCELVGALVIVAVGPSAGVLNVGAAEVRIAPAQTFGLELLLATGSRKHLEQLRARARAAKLPLFAERPAGVDLASEAAIYAALGLAFIAPELREGSGEIDAAAGGETPRLVSLADVRGVLHAHTERSDGRDSLAEMAEATRARGWRYFGVADHSQAAHYAGGLSPESVQAQWREADRLNARQGGGLHVFKGVEADILVDGGLDYDATLLAGFDFVVASVHSRFNLAREQQTERLIRAVQNPFTTILGHMTGRLLLKRPGYECDVDAVLKACAEAGVAVEINADPHRLDLDWRWHARALALGCLLSINPDAHATEELDLVRWGVMVARKGGVPPERVLNCWPRARLAAYFLKRQRTALACAPHFRGEAPERRAADAPAAAARVRAADRPKKAGGRAARPLAGAPRRSSRKAIANPGD